MTQKSNDPLQRKKLYTEIDRTNLDRKPNEKRDFNFHVFFCLTRSMPKGFQKKDLLCI